jgi:hypothetical protein
MFHYLLSALTAWENPSGYYSGEKFNVLNLTWAAGWAAGGQTEPGSHNWIEERQQQGAQAILSAH